MTEENFLSNIDKMFEDLLGRMDSGGGLAKCPYCRYDVYFPRNQLRYHLMLTHWFDGDRRAYHTTGDKEFCVSPLK